MYPLEGHLDKGQTQADFLRNCTLFHSKPVWVSGTAGPLRCSTSSIFSRRWTTLEVLQKLYHKISHFFLLNLVSQFIQTKLNWKLLTLYIMLFLVKHLSKNTVQWTVYSVQGCLCPPRTADWGLGGLVNNHGRQLNNPGRQLSNPGQQLSNHCRMFPINLLLTILKEIIKLQKI